MNRSIVLGKFLVSAGLAAASGAWATYLFEPVNPAAQVSLFVIPFALFGAGLAYDLAHKRAALLPPVMTRIVRFERRSFQAVLDGLSAQERSELGRMFAGGAENQQGGMAIYRKRAARSWRPLARFVGVNLGIAVALLLLHAAGVWLFLPDNAQIDQIAQHVQLQLRKTPQGVIEFGGVINELYTPIETISEATQAAVIAREDSRFLSHWGWDWRGKLRAMSKSAAYLATFGQFGGKQGGSTITEQLAKNLFLSADRGLFSGLRRKFKERILAFKLETHYDKLRILEMYLNRVYFGKGAYGIETAARLYFNRQPGELRDMDAYEAAMLAQSLPRPNAYNCVANPERATKETRKLLTGMGMPIDEARLTATVERCARNGQRSLNIPEVRYLRDWIVAQINAADYAKHLRGDFTVVTTMNARVQRFAQDAVTATFARAEQNGLFSWGNAPQAALVMLTPDGAVRAMLGGRNYNESQYQRITQAKRQPGSTFKLFVYLTALEQGWKLEDTISDQPDADGWPRNGTHGHSPTPVTLLDAFAESRNAAAVNLLRRVGADAVKATARRFGITSDFQPDPGLALALGVREITPLEMTAAYTAIGNGGFAVTPYGVIGVRTKGGAIRYWHRPGKPQRIVKEAVVKDAVRLLRAVVKDGTGRGAQFGDDDIGGKTGTTQGNSDAWFIGCSAHLCAGVWMGYDTPQSMAFSGGSLPAEIFRESMRKTHDALDFPPKTLPQ